MIMRSLGLILTTLGVLISVFVNGQTQSPCPGTYDYQSDGYSMYGIITIQPNGPVSYVNVKANFTIAARLPTNYYGSLEPLQQNDLERRLARGYPIKYRVNFPVVSPLPLVTSITANGKLLCYGAGDVPGPNQIVTTINLEHVLTVSPEPGYSPFITDFIVPENIDVPGDFDDLFDGKPVSITTNRVRPPTHIILEPQINPSINLRPQINTPINLRPQINPPIILRPQPTRTSPAEEHTGPQHINMDIPMKPAEQGTDVECGVLSLGPNALILQGDEYLRGEWPWVVALFKRNGQQLKFICSATLVSEWHVISAAHCLYVHEVVTKTSDVLVRVGAYDLDDVTDDIAKNIYIDKAVAHDAFNPYTLKNDIIILTLQKKVVYNNYIRPVCLWSDDQTDLSLIVDKRGVVVGWGANEIGQPGRGKPRKARMPVVSWETCKASREDFVKLTSDMTLCAGDRNGTGPCNGDSGGGFYMKEQGDRRWKIRGVVSISLHSDDGEYECNVQQYIVFTDIAKYLPWIKSIISRT